MADQQKWTRRGALGAGMASLAAGLAACATPDSKPIAKKEPMRFDDPVWNREMAAKLQAHTDGRQVYGRCTGTISGVRPGEAVKHLMNFEVFSTIRVVKQADGSYDRMCKEVIFYTDPVTGVIMDEWDNPYTGERVKVVDVANDPYNWVIREYIGAPPLPGVDVKFAPPPAVKKPFLLPWKAFGPDIVTVSEDFHGYYRNKLEPAKWKRESAGEFVQSSELFRYFIRRADLENPDMDHLPHEGSWVRITPWLPWMLMGQQTGHILYDGIFAPNETTEFISPAVIARVKTKFPDYMTAPTRWYGPSLTSIEHYALEQTPAPVK